LSALVQFDELAAQVPQQTLQVAATTPTPWASNTGFMSDSSQSKVVENILDHKQVKQQLEIAQSEDLSRLSQQTARQTVLPNDYDRQLERMLQSRRGSDLQRRNAALQAAAQQAILDQRLNLKSAAAEDLVSEGISQPVWIGEELLLVRRVKVDGEERIQGCWLDWPQIRGELLGRVASLLPTAALEPITDSQAVRLTRVLATLPAQLVVPDPVPSVNALSPIRMSLAAGWSFLALATVAMAVLLKGVVALSERRASFVSAVTHELRTPLTTFRMYAEMLLEGMVRDADQRQKYLETLKVEADRLAHLVENVLQYARLERGSAKRRREQMRVGELIERWKVRLSERARQAEMAIQIEAEEDVRNLDISTDPSAVEQIVFNLVDNSCKYAVAAKDRTIHLRFSFDHRWLTIQVADHGPGIAIEERKRLFRPFSKSAKDAANSAPGVGLGLALCRRLALELGGGLRADDASGGGASLTLTLPRSAKGLRG
jgi:signal transduction histidine kinase